MNIAVTRAAEGLARRAWTVAEIRQMVEAGIIAEDENFELIEGEAVPMASKGNQHEVVKSALISLLARHISADMRLAVETSLYLAEHTFLEPDICVYEKRILPEDVRGPDVLLAIEVAASSLVYDSGLKARIYAKHGVRELWVVEAASRVTWVHMRPGVDGSWGTVEKRPAEAVLTTPVLRGLAIRMADLD